MRNNKTALQHPTIKRKIRIAALRVFMRARATGKSQTEYVANRKGNNIMRISYYPNSLGFAVWGDQSRNITDMVMPIIGEF